MKILVEVEERCSRNIGNCQDICFWDGLEAEAVANVIISKEKTVVDRHQPSYKEWLTTTKTFVEKKTPWATSIIKVTHENGHEIEPYFMEVLENIITPISDKRVKALGW